MIGAPKRRKQNRCPMSDEKEIKSIFHFAKTFGPWLGVAAAFLISFGVFQAKDAQKEQRIAALEATKPEQLTWRVELNEKRIVNLEGDQKNLRDTIFEMKTKIDVIAEWVKDQKNKG